MQFLLATRNPHKAKEIGAVLQGLPCRFVGLGHFPGIPEVVEDGLTLEENAAKKARQPAEASGLWTLSDDTGLEVPALGGAPGVHSARYAGPKCSYEDNNRKLLAALKELRGGKRRAAFRCVVALASPDGRIVAEEGRLEGMIAQAPRGKDGFGYDPIFIPAGSRKTLAELPPEEKNALSHRFIALERIRPHIRRIAEAEGSGGPDRRGLAVCPLCGSEMEGRHCRERCPGCGYRIDCGDPF